MQLPATKVTGHYRIRTFVVSGVCSRKKESFTFVESFNVTTCKNLLRHSLLKHEQAMSMAFKIMQLADDLFLQAGLLGVQLMRGLLPWHDKVSVTQWERRCGTGHRSLHPFSEFS